MARPPFSAVLGYVRKSPGAPKGCLVPLVVLPVAIFAWSIGWTWVIHKHKRSRQQSKKVRDAMVAARKSSGPVVYDIDPRAPRAMPFNDELLAWLDRALGRPAPTHLAENVGVCWHNRDVFESVYRFAATETYEAVPGLTSAEVSPFEEGGPGDWFVLRSSAHCTYLFDRAVPRAEMIRNAPRLADWDDRAWSRICQRVSVYPHLSEPRERWDSLDWLHGRSDSIHGEYLVLHDLRYALSWERSSTYAILGSWRDLTSANAAAEAFNRRIGIATCVVRGKEPVAGWY